MDMWDRPQPGDSVGFVVALFIAVPVVLGIVWAISTVLEML